MAKDCYHSDLGNRGSVSGHIRYLSWDSHWCYQRAQANYREGQT